MRTAFTFPGQGSQIVGMGKELAEQSREARAVFEEVDEALKQKLSTIIFEGPQEDLTLTTNAQPALMAVSMAVLRTMQAQGLNLKEKVKYLAGHSLGEYSALCAAGVFSLADTAKLLRIRGQAMQAAVSPGKGAMAAIIGLEEAAIEEICHEAKRFGVCQIANDNGAGQIVISGEKEAVEKAVALASEKQAKRAVLLPVSAPFHSALMQPAVPIMEEALAKVTKHQASIPVICNVTVTPEQDPDKIVKLLLEQVTGRVRWRETIEWFAKNDIDTLCEVGAGKVLSGLARRTCKDIKTVSIASMKEIEEAMQLLNV